MRNTFPEFLMHQPIEREWSDEKGKDDTTIF